MRTFPRRWPQFAVGRSAAPRAIFVVARVNYTRFVKSPTVDFDEAFDKITASAQKFNVEKIKQDDVAKAAGGPPDDE